MAERDCFNPLPMSPAFKSRVYIEKILDDVAELKDDDREFMHRAILNHGTKLEQFTVSITADIIGQRRVDLALIAAYADVRERWRMQQEFANPPAPGGAA